MNSRPGAHLPFPAPALLAALLTLPLLACSGEPSTDASSSSSSSSGSGGDGGGSATSTTTSSSTGAPFSLCQPSKLGLQGSLDGEPIETAYARMKTRTGDSTWQAFFQTQGHVALFAETPLTMPGVTTPAAGLFRMPLEGPHPGAWFCAGTGSNVTLSETEKTFTLASLARLGACPGTPVAGEITACLGSDPSFCPKGKTLTSTLEGASFDWTDAIGGWGGMPGLYEVRLENGGILALYIELDTVLGGLLVIAPGSPDEGAAYCFSGGSLQPGSETSIKFTLGGLSRLGTCAEAKPVAGELSGCTQ